MQGHIGLKLEIRGYMKKKHPDYPGTIYAVIEYLE